MAHIALTENQHGYTNIMARYEWDVTVPARCRCCGSKRVTRTSYDYGQPYYLKCSRCKQCEPLELREIRVLSKIEVQEVYYGKHR